MIHDNELAEDLVTNGESSGAGKSTEKKVLAK